MRKLLHLLILVGLFCLGHNMTFSSTQVGVGAIRFINATANGTPVDVFLEDMLVARQIVIDSGYFTFNSGEYSVVFQNQLARTQSTFVLEPASRLTVILIGNAPENFEVITITDDATLPTRNYARIQVLNAVVNAPSQSVSVDGRVWDKSIAFAEFTIPHTLLAGNYELVLETTSRSPIIVSPNRYYLFIFTESRFISVTAQPLRGNGSTRFRYMNLVEATYDVYINQTLVYSNVLYRQVTDEFVIAPGTYTFEVYPAGTNPPQNDPVVTIEATISEDQSLLIIGAGNPIQLFIYEDDLSPIPVNTARLQIIHLWPSVPEFSMISQTKLQLIDQMNYGNLRRVSLPGGNYAFDLVNTNDRLVGHADAVVGSGQLVTLVIFGTDRQFYASYAEPLEQVALTRFVHASPTLGPVDFYLNGNVLLSNMQYRSFTEYLSLLPGRYDLAIYQHGVSPESATPLVTDEIFVTADSIPFTLVLIGTQHLRVTSYADDLEILPAGRARIRFIHAAINVSSLSVINSADNSILAAGLAFGQGSSNLTVSANTRTFNFVHVNVGVIYRLSSFRLEPGGNYTFILLGNANEPTTLQTLVLSR